MLWRIDGDRRPCAGPYAERMSADGRDDVPTIAPDQIAFAIAQLAARGDNGRAISAPTVELRESLMSEVGEEGLDGREAAEALDRYLPRLEQAMREMAVRHSRAYWLMLTRRLPPTPIAGLPPASVALYRRFVTLAVLKHGLGEFPDKFAIVGEG
jgi:hypothetical protein